MHEIEVVLYVDRSLMTDEYDDTIETYSLYYWVSRNRQPNKHPSTSNPSTLSTLSLSLSQSTIEGGEEEENAGAGDWVFWI